MIKKILMLIILLSIASLSAAFDSDDSMASNKLLSFDFQQIPVRDLLAILAKDSGKSFIINEKVQGVMSLHLDHVTWQQALALILNAQGLAKQEMDNVIIIAPGADISMKEQAQLDQLQKQNQQIPLRSEVIPLHYAKGEEIAAMLKDKNNNLLSARGNVGTDHRTNSIWLEDIPEQLSRVEDLIKKLDVPTPQVQIEARIVTVDTNYEQDLGIRFGVSGGHHLSGTLAGANALNKTRDITQVPLKDRLSFDFPDLVSSGANGGLGLAMLKLADGYMLDLELSALQAEGAGEIIANPRLMTANQESATIQTGEDIPYQEKTSSGATSVAFKKAVLSLSVIPQITADNKILLKLKISQDKPSSRLVNGVPAITTREIETQVLVNNNQVIVLGGIYEESQSHQIDRIPFLSDIPAIGKLFQHKYDSQQKRELLIFVQPKILLS